MRKSIIILIHLGYWALYFILISFFFLAMPVAHKPTLGHLLFSSQLTLTIIFPALLGFYSFYTILFKQLLQKKRIVPLLFFGIIISLICGLFSLLMIRLIGPAYVLNERDSILAGTLFISLLALVHGIVALVMNGFINWYGDIKLKEELNRKNYEMELELIKSQVNPHFLFNTINNIDVLIQKDPPKASLYLNKLSDIMRFMLYETKSDKIPLTKELVYIEKYIDLQRIRTSNPDYVHYNIEGDETIGMIEPMLFIPFIENAFKHAENKKAGNTINIKFIIQRDTITFLCDNKFSKNIQKPPDKNGLGIELIRKRLMLLYPGKHALQLTDENDIYKVKLTLKNAC